MVKRQQESKPFISFAKRLRDRRTELAVTRNDIQVWILRVINQKVSLETIRNMEKKAPVYRLPKRRATGELTPIEAIAKALDVPLGYLLGGFSKKELESSCFASQIANASIELTHTLRQVGREERLADFLKSLPEDKSKLLKLPLHSYRNERAFAVIFKIEKIYCGLELLIVNEPPLLFWDDEDVRSWITNMAIDSADADTLYIAFKEYRDYFRGLVRNNKKKYRIVLNRPTFVKWLRRKAKENRRQQLCLMEEFVAFPNFEILFSSLNQNSDKIVDEKEVICAFQEIPDTMEDTLAIQILQTPPDHRPVEYFLTPIPPNKLLLQTEKSKIDLAWAAALDEARQYVSGTTAKSQISEIALAVLNRLRVELDAVEPK